MTEVKAAAGGEPYHRGRPGARRDDRRQHFRQVHIDLTTSYAEARTTRIPLPARAPGQSRLWRTLSCRNRRPQRSALNRCGPNARKALSWPECICGRMMRNPDSICANIVERARINRWIHATPLSGTSFVVSRHRLSFHPRSGSDSPASSSRRKLDRRPTLDDARRGPEFSKPCLPLAGRLRQPCRQEA